MGESTLATESCKATWTIVFDSQCPVVKRLGWLLDQWDKHSAFRYINRDSSDRDALELIERLEKSDWSLMLVDNQGNSWHGPEAIPFILKNLPAGKIAAVSYTIPGTMWLTRKLYHFVSRQCKMVNNTSATKVDCLNA